MARLRNACGRGADAMVLAELAISEIQRYKGFKRAGMLSQRVESSGPIHEGTHLGAWQAQYSPESKLVSVNVTLDGKACEHSFWFTWPELKLNAYAIFECSCTNTRSRVSKR